MTSRWCWACFIFALVACVHDDVTSWKAITVAPGETLFQISQQYHVDIKKLQSKNHLSDPDIIRAGQELFVPAWDASVTNSAPIDTDDSFNVWIATLASQSQAIVNDPDVPQSSTWISPVNTSPKTVGQFLRYHAKTRLPVRAARSGEVLYVGFVTQRDQACIVIKHYQNYLSIYQGIVDSQVKAGRYIHQGDTLGFLEEDTQGDYVLDFEIRHNASRLNTGILLAH